MQIPSQCKLCTNFNLEESLCSIYEQLPGEYTRENVKDCPSFIEKGSKESQDLDILIKYMDEDPDGEVEAAISAAVGRILNEYESKFKVTIVGIARRKIKSIIKMVDIIDTVLDRLGTVENLQNMTSSESIRLLSELNHSINNDLTFIMKLVNPETKLQDLQMWIDARSVVNISGSSVATEMKADEITKLSGASRDKIRDAFDALLHNISNNEDIIDVVEQQEVDDEG